MTTQTKKLCAEILALAIGNDEHDIFVQYSPHVEAFSVKIYDGAWAEDKEPVYDCMVYIDDTLFASAMMGQLEEIKSEIENLLTK